MPRQGDGTYVPPSGVSEIVPGATADADDVRLGLLDLGNEITNSLATDGQSQMSGQLVLGANSTAGAPAVVFADATTSGLYTDASDRVGIAVSGLSAALFGNTTVDINYSLISRGTSNNFLGDIYVRNDGDTANTVEIDNTTGNITSQGVIKADDFEFLNGDVYPFPAGTRLAFQNSTAPTGWLKETSANYNDAFIRMTTSTVGTGGTKAFGTGGITITEAELPSHTHGPGTLNFTTDDPGNHNHSIRDSNFWNTDGQGSSQARRANDTTTRNSGGGGAHTHSAASWSGATAATGGGSAMAFKYAEFIIATKS